MKKRLVSVLMVACLLFCLTPNFMLSTGATSNETQIYDFLKNTMGCNTATACGILANIEAESSFNPNNSFVEADGKISYGICQWHADRLESLKSYCGAGYTTLSEQLKFLQYELKNDESYAWSKMQGIENTSNGAYTAGYRWAQYFERCSQYYNGINQYEARGNSAVNKYWAKYGSSSQTTSAPTNVTLKTSATEGNTSTKITLSWSATGATSYYLFISEESGDVLMNQGGFTTTSYSRTYEPGVYYATVSATNSAGTTNAKTGINFTITKTESITSSIDLTKPTNNASYEVGDTIPCKASVSVSGTNNYYTKFFLKPYGSSSSVNKSPAQKPYSSPSDSIDTSGLSAGTYNVYATLYVNEKIVASDSAKITLTAPDSADSDYEIPYHAPGEVDNADSDLPSVVDTDPVSNFVSGDETVSDAGSASYDGIPEITTPLTTCSHSFGAWSITEAATCTTDGNRSRTCKLCGETETAVIQALGHSYSQGTCTRCGATEFEYPAGSDVHFGEIYSYTHGQFKDVSENQWFSDSVANAVKLGLMRGNSATSFNPYGDVTLAEAITMAARIHSIYTTGTEDFVQTGTWYQVYLDYAYQNGIISYELYKRDVTAKATRAQFAEIFAAALPSEALGEINTIADNTVPDVKTSASCGSAVYKLYRAGILSGGDATGTFSPATFITRAECATIVARMADSDNRVQFSL